MDININKFLFKDVLTVKGVGKKLKKYLKKKNIEKVKDLLFDLPYGIVDRSKISSLDELEIGKIANIKVKVIKYNFPRVRNLPSKVICSEGLKKINIVFFNANEFYIKKLLPINKSVFISGKISYYNKNYQITNPTYVKEEKNMEEILKIFPKYSLTEGLTEKIYRKLINKTLDKIKGDNDWLDNNFLKKNKFSRIKETFNNLHNPANKINIFSNDYRRIVYDEILSNLLMLIKARKITKIRKESKKPISDDVEKIILNNFSFKLTVGQKKILKELDADIKSIYRMFRLIQGDVGSGKTILALVLAAKVCKSNYQVAYMAPTEILSIQQYEQTKKLLHGTNINCALLTRNTVNKDEIIENLETGKISFVVGTHSLFQKKVRFKNLGLIIIDEQHKFGVKQRISLARKGGNNCDVLLMSATPIPRTMMMSLYGDMDISKLTEKPLNRKKILTLVKPENKMHEIIPLLKKQLQKNNQIFWVCPLIEKSKKLNFTSSIEKYNSIKNIFPNNVGIIHGNLDESEKNLAIKNFIDKKINIMVCTTVIEVGIDIPSANTIIIEDANKFGLSQLHQLRGRVGRGQEDSLCILLYKNNLSENGKKRLKIMRSTSNGFEIAEEDLKLRGHGDLLGFQQSGIKDFRFADPIHHKDLFTLAESEITKLDKTNLLKFETLLKLYDKAEIINQAIE